MGVSIYGKYNLYLDDEQLVRIRSEQVDELNFGIEMMPAGMPPKFRKEYTPGTMIGLDGKLFEILAAFRLSDEPHVWQFLCQEIPDLGTPREVVQDIEPNFGFNWGDVLPRVVYELFTLEHDAIEFFECLWTPAFGKFWVFSTQEMLRSKIVLPVTEWRRDIEFESREPHSLPRPREFPLLEDGLCDLLLFED